MFRKRPVEKIASLALCIAVITACSSSASASIMDLRNAASSNPNLIHHWTFEGGTDAAQRADKKGSSNLTRVTEGASTAAGWAPGFGGEGQAAATYRNGLQDGSGYRSGAFDPPDAGTIEYLFNPTLLEGHFVSSQSATRMYAGVFSDGDVGTAFGSAGWPAPFEAYATDSSTPDIEADHWYYVAVTYEWSNTSGGQFEINSYIADLTEGQTTLSTGFSGVIKSAASSPHSQPLGIGLQAVSNGQNYFEGFVDEVAWYDEVFSLADAQAHLDHLDLASAVPEPATGLTILLGMMGLFMRGSRSRPRRGR